MIKCHLQHPFKVDMVHICTQIRSLLLVLFVFKSIITDKITNTSASTLARVYFSNILGRYYYIADDKTKNRRVKTNRCACVRV